jgi:ComF family protein
MQKILSYLIPHICVLCRMPSNRNKDLCLACEKELPYFINGCKICGTKLADEIELICGKCLGEPPPFATTIGLLRYETPVDHLIAGLKFRDKLLYADLLGKMLAERLQKIYTANKPEIIIPVPLHKERLRERGFNQAYELARPIAKKFKIPIDLKSCLRIKHTTAQSLIHADERHRNIKNAFKIIKPVTYKHVAILDDVVTTGSTVRELSMVLCKAGVETIDVWCVAKT